MKLFSPSPYAHSPHSPPSSRQADVLALRCPHPGEAMERHYGGCLCYGPPIEDGFYYDMLLEGRQVSSMDFDQLDTLFRGIVKEKQPFVQLEMSKEELLEMFKVCWCVGEG